MGFITNNQSVKTNKARFPSSHFEKKSQIYTFQRQWKAIGTQRNEALTSCFCFIEYVQEIESQITLAQGLDEKLPMFGIGKKVDF